MMDEQQLALLYTSTEELHAATKAMLSREETLLGRLEMQIHQLSEARVAVDARVRTALNEVATEATAVAAANATPEVKRLLEQLTTAANDARTAARLLSRRGLLVFAGLVLVFAGAGWMVYDGVRAERQVGELRPQLELARALRSHGVELGCADRSCYITVNPSAKPLRSKDGKQQWLLLGKP